MSCPNLDKRQYLLDNLAGIQADIDQHGTRYAEEKWGFGNSTLSRYRREGKLSLHGERHIAHSSLALPAQEDNTAYQALDRCPNHFCTGRLLPNDGYGDEYGHNPLHCDMCGKTPGQARAREAEIQAKKTHPPAPRAIPAPEIQNEEEPMTLTEAPVRKPEEITTGSATVTEVKLPDKPYKCPDCPASFEEAKDLGHHRHFRHGYISPRKLAKVGEEKPLKCPDCPRSFDKKKALSLHHSRAHGKLKGQPRQVVKVETTKPAKKAKTQAARPSRFTPELLAAIAADMQTLTYNEVLKKHGISSATIFKYRRLGKLPPTKEYKPRQKAAGAATITVVTKEQLDARARVISEATPPILSGKPVDTPPPATRNKPVITGLETRKRSVWLKENLPDITKDILAGLSYRQMQEKWHLSGDTLAKYRRRGLLPFSDGSYSSGKCTTGEAFGSRTLLLKPDEKLENGRVYSTAPPKPQPTVFPPFSRWWWPSVQCEWMRTFKALANPKPGDSNAPGK